MENNTVDYRYFYSPETRGFYCDAIHVEMPEDALEITVAHYTELLEGQCQGEVIMPPDKEHALPYLAESPSLSNEELASAIRLERNERIAATDYLMVADYPLDGATREHWVTYRQALRDITAQQGFPENITWPEEPKET